MNLLKITWAAFTLAAVGCTDGHTGPATGPGDPPATTPPASTTPVPTPPPPAMAQLRVVHLTPDAKPFDLCIAPHGTTSFRGPLLKQSGVDPTGLAYTQATSYLALPAMQYDFRLVDGASGACDSGMIDATDLPALDPGQHVTVAALGLMHPPAGNNNTLSLALYVDDAGVAPGPIALRFIHASPDTSAVDAGMGSGNQFTPAFLNVAYGAVGHGGTSGANGYIMIPPPEHPPLLTVRLIGYTDDALTFTPPAQPASGDILTAFLIGDQGGTPAPFKALVCVDNAVAAGALADCAVRP